MGYVISAATRDFLMRWKLRMGFDDEHDYFPTDAGFRDVWHAGSDSRTFVTAD